MNLLRLSLLCFAAALLTACATRTEPPVAMGGHAHVAPHGGTLVELGDHLYSLELVRDRATGKLTAWILDAHAENAVRIAAPSIDLIAMPGGQFTPLSLKAVAAPATGEAVGESAQFETQADWLKTADEFAGIVTLEIKGAKFEQVPYMVH